MRPRSAAAARRALSVAAQGFAEAPPATPPRRVVVTGVGMVTPLAASAPRTWARLLAGDSGVRELTPEDLPGAPQATHD
jgi:3-oxoacyl-[acyl-carrier-protein] synthase II